MQADLIFDVGVNDGVDSAYYLTKSRRVIGVEASPPACERLQRRFASEIAEGRYTLLNVGIARDRGEMPFWVCDDHPDWSSFSQEIASRQGSRHHPVTVPTCSFADVIAEHGVPTFAKIDIEGHDRLCLEALTPDTAPPYISVELSHADGSLVDLLAELGYRDFKIVSQTSFAPVSTLLTRALYALSGRSRVTRRLHSFDRRCRGAAGDGDWKFAMGSSGPFGPTAPGRWVNAGRARATWRFLHDIDKRYGGVLGEWYDIHARRA